MAARAIKLAIGDCLLTSMWVFCAATLGASTSAISAALGVQGPVTLLITTFLVATLVFVFSFVGEILGGASFNPTGTVAFYVAGFSKESLFSMAICFPAQAAGAVGGALPIKEVMPEGYKHMLSGPKLKVDLHTGAIAEGVLTFLISLAVLTIIVKVLGGMLVKTWLLSMATVALVVTGSSYTGPSMNPANMLDYNVPRGKLNRGLSVVDSYRLLKGSDLTYDEFFLSSALGWCIEWLQAYFLVLDDIMDNSHTRRGQPCWFKVPQVGMIVVNDGIILRNHIHRILKNHFKGKSLV